MYHNPALQSQMTVTACFWLCKEEWASADRPTALNTARGQQIITILSLT